MTLKEIAKIANVSIATVSKVINNKTDDLSETTVKKVESILESENYLPNHLARAMKLNKTNIIALIIPDVRNPFFTELARGAEDIALERGYSLFLCNTDDNFEKELNYLKTINSMQCDGVIIAGAFKRNKKMEKNQKFKTPIIQIDRDIHYPNIISKIKGENYKSSFELAVQLVEKGYRSFLYLSGHADSSVSVDRENGIKDALNTYSETQLEIIQGKFSVDFGYQAIMSIKNIKKFDVIVCGNDLIAVGVLRALKESNLSSPVDIGVTGFDGISFLDSLGLQISTVSQDMYEIGALSVKVLDDFIQDKEIKKEYVTQQKIMFRETTS